MDVTALQRISEETLKIGVAAGIMQDCVPMMSGKHLG